MAPHGTILLAMKVLRCAQCGTPVSLSLVELDDVERLNLADGRPLLPRGAYLPMRRHPNWWEESLDDERADDILINLDDAINTHLGGVLNGCCGIDGCDGINTFCPHGHEIGTEFSDCWGPHSLTVPKRCVEVTDAPDSVTEQQPRTP
jgi:hypothetical protein